MGEIVPTAYVVNSQEVHDFLMFTESLATMNEILGDAEKAETYHAQIEGASQMARIVGIPSAFIAEAVMEGRKMGRNAARECFDDFE